MGTELGEEAVDHQQQQQEGKRHKEAVYTTVLACGRQRHRITVSWKASLAYRGSAKPTTAVRQDLA